MASETEREFELVLGNRQLFSVLFIVIVLLAVFFAMGYVMGRQSAPPEVVSRTTPGPRTEASPKQSAASGEVRKSETTQPAQSETPAQSVASAAAPPDTPKPIEVGPISVSEPQIGQSYWQVSAVAKSEAELLVEVLSKKGFRAIVAPGPNEKLFRVLVGPAKDPGELSKLRTDLEQAGFKPYLRKY